MKHGFVRAALALLPLLAAYPEAAKAMDDHALPRSRRQGTCRSKNSSLDELSFQVAAVVLIRIVMVIQAVVVAAVHLALMMESF